MSANKTRYALLGMLSIAPATGYELKKHIEQTTDHFWREGHGSIYPTLKCLEAEGLVQSQLEDADSAKPKKRYRLLDSGKKELKNWLNQSDIIMHSRNELLLKIFFGANIAKEVIVKHIQKFRYQCEDKLQHLQLVEQRIKKAGLEGNSVYRYYCVRWGIEHTKTSLRWCDEIEKNIKVS